MRLITILLIVWPLANSLFAAASLTADSALISSRHTNATPLLEGPDDTNILKWTARIIEHSHYNRQPFDTEVSSRFLDRYLDSWDNQHIYFLQSDLREFDIYRDQLDRLTRKVGDSSPARQIFTRFRERLDQQNEYVNTLLKNEKFEFTGTDRFLLNRKTLPRPKDLTEAKRLWRERLRYEYLQEKLSIGRPEIIGDIVLEKLKQGQPRAISGALQDKVSKEKAEAISKFVLEQLGEDKVSDVPKVVLEKSKKQTPEQIAQLVVAKLEKDNAEEIVKIISKRYARVQRAVRDYDNDDVIQVYLTALTHVYDPHSDYFGKAELENFSIGMKLSLFGIGAVLRSEDGFCKIQELKPGPAMRSKKLKPNDRIIAVAQSNQPPVDVVDMKLSKVVEMIRGPKGTEVQLTVIPADAADPSVRQLVTLIREEIKLEDQEAKARILELPFTNSSVLRFGVIDLPSFYSSFELEGRKPDGDPKSTTTDVAQLLKKLMAEKVSGVILDLRRNGGGSLEEAIRLTGLFIREGPVVQVRDYDGRKTVDEDPDSSMLYDGPLIVLTSRFSASASEILAGALQDYGRALIVGDSSTHGKGTVQSLIQLAPILRGNGVSLAGNPGALKITIRKFYRVSGSSTQLKGVTPDIVLPSVNNHLDVGESSLDNPLPWDTIAAADYEKFNSVTPYLEETKKRSDQRVATDRDFSFVREEIARYKKLQEEKSVSLNEAQRLKEKQETDDRAKARKKELAARPEPPGKVYELTLKQAALPGLPAPVGRTNHVKSASTNAPTKSDTELAQAKTEARAKSADADDEDDDAAIEDKPALDVTLEETKRILMDLVSLSGKSLLVVTKPADRN
jgi:carboxyl-terminal processing protease